MKELLILGTGVHGAEIAEIVRRVNQQEETWNLLGFVGKDDRLTGQEINGLTVLGGPEKLAEHPQAYFVPDNTWPRAIDLPRERLASLVDPSSCVSRTSRLGAGCVIFPHGYVGLNAQIGDFVFCLAGSVINHDCVIASGTVLASGATLAGGVRVEEDCLLGQSCTIREFVRIGRNCLIGMGAVVLEDVPPDSVMVGNPARRLRLR